MSRTLLTIDDLVAAGLVAADAAKPLRAVAARYAVAVPSDIAQRIDRENPDDPLRRQFVPNLREQDALREESADPIGDDLKSPVRGIVHRYPDRVLLKITHVCPVYCRFCFRREMVGPNATESLTRAEIDAALAYIAADAGITEVILTGGDPFILSPRRVADITRRLSDIDHVRTLRWHTRVPIVTPDRVTDAFVTALTATDRRVVVALHCNHPNELSQESEAAVARLGQANVHLLSQSVLLRGVNDDVDTLEHLMRRFVSLGIKPYYLHHGDLAPGTSHFRTTLRRGLELMTALHHRLADDAVPRYTLDLPGAHGKIPIETHAQEISGQPGRYRITARDGAVHIYTDVVSGDGQPSAHDITRPRVPTVVDVGV